MKRRRYSRRKASRKINAWQRAARLTGREIARTAGISEAHYSDISKGKQRGSIEVLARITGVLGHSLDDRFTDAPPGYTDAEESKHLKQICSRETRGVSSQPSEKLPHPS